MDRMEVRDCVRSAIFDKLLTMNGTTTLSSMADSLADVVVERLEALDATVLERPSPVVMPYEAV